MAVDVFGVTWRSHLAFRRLPVLCIRKTRYSKSTVTIEPALDPVKLPEKVQKDGAENGQVKKRRVGREKKEPEWEKFNSKELGIKMSSISKPTLLVLRVLRKSGHEVYLVGGCVRDLILKRTPKDFDIITSAELKEVRRTFTRCEIVGKRFPICHVHIDDTTLEVSSFSTCGSNSNKKFDNLRKPPGCDRLDFIRWKNCLHRDFTINGLMFDPHAKLVYDYMGGMQDIRKSKMRTVIPANISFVEDCARILRAVRIAARLGFYFTKDLALSLKELSSSVRKLDKGRILMEINYMLGFGSSEASLRLLWRFGLLETLLPIQASYFASQGFRRRDERSNMLLSLFSNLDKLVAPNQPCHSSLWVAILAFHKALADKPRDPLVIAAFALALSAGGSLSTSIEIARTISKPHESTFHEISEPTHTLSEKALTDEIVDLAASVRSALRKMTDRDYVSQAMIRFPKAPRSDLVFVPLALTLRTGKIFECVKRHVGFGSVPKIGRRIDYDALVMGNLPEIRQVFATIVYRSVFPER